MKKTLIAMLTLALLLSTLVGAIAEEEVTLTFWQWDDAQVPAMQSMIDAYTATHPNVKIEISCVPDNPTYGTKLRTVLGTADAPNIFWMDLVLAKEYLPTGIIQDLTPYIEETGLDLSDLNANVQKIYTYNDHIYAIPKDVDGVAIYYNKALFDAAGLPYPDSSWDIDQFCETARALTKDGIVGYTNSTSDRIWTDFLLSNGGELYNEDGTVATVNSDASAEMFQKLLDLMNEGAAYNGMQLAETSANSAFTSGVAAMTFTGSWMISQFSAALGDNLGICEIPSGKAGKVNAGQGLGFATTTSNPYMEETLDFLAFLSTAEAQKLQAQVVIPASNACASTWEDQYPELDLSPFTKSTEYFMAWPRPYKNYNETGRVFAEYVSYMLYGEYETAKEMLDDANEAMNVAINE